MTSVATDDERQQIEEDIQRIKSALEASSGDWQFSVEIEESEEDEEDALKIICPDWTPDGEHQRPPTASLETTTADAGAYVKETRAEDGLSADSEQLVQMGVALNRAYQDIVAENLEMVQLLLVQNQEKQKEIEKAISDDLAAKSYGDRKGKRRNPVNYGYPYFRNKDGLPPPLNYEAQCKKATEEPEPFLRPVKMWTKKEKEILQKAIQEDLIRQKLQPILNRRELDIEKLAQAKGENDMEQAAILSEKIDSLDKEIRKIKKNPVEISDDVDSYIDSVDWMKISTIDFNGSRRDDECYLFWRNYLQPNINSSKWTPEEDGMLKELALEFDCCNWELIAQKLGTKRSAFQCLQRYQTKLNPCLQAGKWSTEEDNFLKEVISSVRVGDTIPWDQVSYYMDCRSNEQCEQRWQQLQNMFKTGRWTEDEDKLLLDAVHRFGKEWIKVKDMVPNRTAQQCRERYVNTLSRGNKIGSWRYAEDKILWQCCQESTTLKWAQISANIPGRSDNSCLQRYRLLLRLKQVEDILLKTADGKTIVDKLLRKKPKPRSTHIPSESSRDIKLKNMRRMIKKNEDIIADAEKKVDLLNISASSRTERSLQYHQNKIAEARERIAGLQDKITRLENQATNVIPAERLSYQDRLTDMAEALRDRENGIYVPRPLLGMHGLSAMLSSLENQLWVKKVIQRKTELELRNLPEGSTLSLDMTPQSEENQPEAVTQVSQVKTTKPKISQTRKRRKTVDEEMKVSQQIFELVDNFTRKQSAGRPRKCGQRSPNDPGEKERVLMEHNVFRIFVDALNLDVEGTKLQAKKRLMEIRNSSVDIQEKALPADLDLFQKALNCKLDGGENTHPCQSSQSATITNLTLQMLPRRAIEGPNAVRAYNLPPLPPTVSTLMGFKSLLLKRRQLIELSKKKVMIVQQKQPTKSKDVATKGKKRKQCTDEEHSSSADGHSSSVQDYESDDGLPGQHLTSVSPVQQQAGTCGVDRNSGHDVHISPLCNPEPVPLGASAPTSQSLSSPDSASFSASFQSHSSDSQMLMDHHGQARIMILKGCDLTPAALSRVLKSKGIITNPDKVKLQMCKRSELANHILENSGRMNKSMGRRIQSKRTRRKAMKVIRQTHDFQLLKARFKSLFLWPALLSTIMVTSKMEAEKEQTQVNACRHEQQKSQQQLETEQQQQRQQQQQRHQQQGELQYPGYLEEQHKRQEQLMEASTLQKQQHLEQQTELMLEGDDDEEEEEEDGLDQVLNDANDDSVVIPPELLEADPENREQSLKKSKKHKTKRTRYPCSHGKRFRKRVLKPRWVKEQQVERLRHSKQKYFAEKAKQKQQQQQQLELITTDRLCEEVEDEAASESNNAVSAASDVGQMPSKAEVQPSATSTDGCGMEIEVDQGQGQ